VHPACTHTNRQHTHVHVACQEYTGAKASGQDDEMLVKVQSVKITASDARAAAQLAETISLKAKGIDGTYTGKA